MLQNLNTHTGEIEVKIGHDHFLVTFCESASAATVLPFDAT
jgi:hypothetical protein